MGHRERPEVRCKSRGTERRAAGIPNPYLPGAKVPYIAAEWAGVCARPPRAPPPPLARGGRTMENPTGHSLTGAPLPPPRARLYFTRRQSVSFSRSPDTKRAAPLSIGGCRLRTAVMDCPSIPAAALFRQSGTVIVRLKMEPFHGRCCQATLCNATEYGRVVHRTPGCEQCARTRLISHYSDCDSDLVEKCRPYLRSSTARSSKHFFFSFPKITFLTNFSFVIILEKHLSSQFFQLFPIIQIEKYCFGYNV